MTADELAEELESLVEGIEQSLMILAGSAAESGDAVTLLKNLIAGEEAVAGEFGPNGWRDRLVRKIQIVFAMKARPHASDDPALQSLIATLLTAQTETDPRH